jgi:hypothetical protein
MAPPFVVHRIYVSLRPNNTGISKNKHPLHLDPPFFPVPLAPFKISRRQRVDAELFYLSRVAHESFPSDAARSAAHPRWTGLCQGQSRFRKCNIHTLKVVGLTGGWFSDVFESTRYTTSSALDNAR